MRFATVRHPAQRERFRREVAEAYANFLHGWLGRVIFGGQINGFDFSRDEGCFGIGGDFIVVVIIVGG